jgi:hypothetical protein
LIDGAIPASVIGKNFLFFLQCKMSIMARCCPSLFSGFGALRTTKQRSLSGNVVPMLIG